MAKNDYEVIVYKILIYYYAVLKHDISFQTETFNAILSRRDISEEYLARILDMMLKEGLIDGVTVVKAWGQEYVLASDPADISISAEGIRYLKENSKMKKIEEVLKGAPGLVSSLIGIVM